MKHILAQFIYILSTSRLGILSAVCRTVAGKFSIGGLCSSAGRFFVCAGGLDIVKLTKNPLIVFHVWIWGLGALFGGAKPPVATGLAVYWHKKYFPLFLQETSTWKKNLKRSILKIVSEAIRLCVGKQFFFVPLNAGGHARDQFF